MSALEEQSTAASEPNAAERITETSIEFFPDVIEEKSKADLEPPHAQISALIRMMDNLIHDNSARPYPTGSTRDYRFSSKSPLTDNPGSSRTPPLAPLVTTIYSRGATNFWV